MLIFTRYGGASRSARVAPAGHCPACVATAKTWNATRRPVERQVPQPVTDPAHTCRDRRPSRWRIPGRCRCAAAVPARTLRPGRIRQGPRMYEMQGPCPASPHRLASCPALLAQRAARRGQAPVRGTGLPAPPTFPESPPGGARFRTVRTFLLPLTAPRKSPAVSNFIFFRYSRMNSQETCG